VRLSYDAEALKWFRKAAEQLINQVPQLLLPAWSELSLPGFK